MSVHIHRVSSHSVPGSMFCYHSRKSKMVAWGHILRRKETKLSYTAIWFSFCYLIEKPHSAVWKKETVRQKESLGGSGESNYISKEGDSLSTQGEMKEFETHRDLCLSVRLQKATTSGEARQRFNQSTLCLVFMMQDIWTDWVSPFLN